MIFAEINHKKFAEIKQKFLYFFDYFHGFTVKNLFPLMNFISTTFTAALQMENQWPHTCPVPGLRILLQHSTNVVFTGVNRVYRLEIQLVMLVFSTSLVN
jgi:hypothetical protein